MSSAIDVVVASVQALTSSSSFIGWLSDQRPAHDDLVVLNNSFLYRQGVSTNKNQQYLAVPIEGNGSVADTPVVVRLANFNADFKLYRAQSSLPETSTLEEALNSEIERLGHLVFILLGRVEDSVSLSEPLNHRDFDDLVIDPTIGGSVIVEGRHITVRETSDEERVWDGLVSAGVLDPAIDHEALRNALGAALDKLDEKAYARLILPEPADSAPTSAIEQILEVLRDQREEYNNALNRCGGDPDADRSAFNEVLRLAYNFSSDAIGMTRLVVSICDLKAVVLWGSIAEHVQLAEAFRSLPWVRSNQKPSLKGYVETIGDARNAAFHNLFPFRKTLEVALPTGSLQGLNLRIFSEHSRKRHNELRFEDKELVDVLVEFTRARYRRVTPAFWRKNLHVMDRTTDLFEQTRVVLEALNAS